MRFFPAKRLMTWGVALVIALMAIATLLAVLSVRAYTDRAFICENTGSHQGYRQWFFGFQSGRWYRESHLEQYMRREHPSDLVNRWTSYEGTGRNILGQPLRFGHERPGSVLDVLGTLFNRYVDSLDPKAKPDLYHILASGTPEEAKAEIGKVWSHEFEQAQEMQAGRQDQK